MKKLTDKKKIRLYLWLGIIFLLVNMLSNYQKYQPALFQRFVNAIWTIPYITIVHYFFLEHALPTFNRKRILKFVLLLPVFIFLYSIGFYIWRTIGTGLHIYTVFEQFPTTEEAVSDRMAYSMESLFFFAIVRHFYNHYKLRQASQKLRIEKQQAELNYLKSQTNPHFLFNTLNNIYSLARDKSDLAPESILRLSKMLRYMLYETTGSYIAIEQELKIISDYIELEKLRYDDTLHINFNYDIEDMKQSLPPLMLIPLVENAFKHGVSETRGRPFVDIHLSVKARKLMLVIKNSVDSPSEMQPVKESIGLSNLRRQLELLYTDYQLTLDGQPHVFTAILQINLASHALH